MGKKDGTIVCVRKRGEAMHASPRNSGFMTRSVQQKKAAAPDLSFFLFLSSSFLLFFFLQDARNGEGLPHGRRLYCTRCNRGTCHAQIIHSGYIVPCFLLLFLACYYDCDSSSQPQEWSVRVSSFSVCCVIPVLVHDFFSLSSLPALAGSSCAFFSFGRGGSLSRVHRTPARTVQFMSEETEKKERKKEVFVYIEVRRSDTCVSLYP